MTRAPEDFSAQLLFRWIARTLSILVILAFGVLLWSAASFEGHRPPLARPMLLDDYFILGLMLLWWVARSTEMPVATLLISSALFERSVEDWGRVPTLTLARRLGRGRLERLRGVLFGQDSAGME